MGLPSSFAAMRNTASDLKYDVLSVTSTMDEMSSGFFPDRIRSDWPILDCNETKRKTPTESLSRAKFTPPLHKLHTPSNKIIGLLSFENTSLLISFQSDRSPLFVDTSSVVEAAMDVMPDDRDNGKYFGDKHSSDLETST
mmetsp:Transcript_4273/g.5956  ORF Transcript_4273/g.5956 Transcript_4273/m.5956 type:complete len:140 (-) Transcript_4273:379-798(-)